MKFWTLLAEQPLTQVSGSESADTEERCCDDIAQHRRRSYIAMRLVGAVCPAVKGKYKCNLAKVIYP